jgi:hypothetical protein
MVVAAVLLASGFAAEAGSDSSRCDGYVEHLRSARAHLARADRAAALVELRRARKALEACARGEAGEHGLAARARASTIG